MMDFKKDLAQLINIYSIDNEAGTPDYILAEMLVKSLESYISTNHWRKKSIDEDEEAVETSRDTAEWIEYSKVCEIMTDGDYITESPSSRRVTVRCGDISGKYPDKILCVSGKPIKIK